MLTGNTDSKLPKSSLKKLVLKTSIYHEKLVLTMRSSACKFACERNVFYVFHVKGIIVIYWERFLMSTFFFEVVYPEDE